MSARRSKRAKANGKTNGAKRASPANVRRLRTSEKASLTRLNNELAEIKLALGDVDLRRAALDARRGELLNRFQRTQERLSETGNEIAKAHGVDPEGNPAEQGAWTLDLDRMVMQRRA